MINIELNLKAIADIDSYQMIFRKLKIEPDQLNITNKHYSPNLENSITKIQARFPKAKIVPHYSISENYSGNIQNALNNLKKFIEFTQQQANIDHVLLVSGNPKNKFDSIQALTEINMNQKFGCAYTPQENTKETIRLESKLEHANVNNVYIQLTDDLNLISSSISKIRKLKQSAKIFIPILIPSKKILNSLKFRPWNGVELSPQFLESIEYAQTKVKEIKKLAESEDCEVLIEILNPNTNPQSLEFYFE